MKYKPLIQAITTLLECNEASQIYDVASEMFNNAPHTTKTMQLSDVLTDKEFEKMQDIYSDWEIDTFQNIIDVFINSLE